MNQLIIACFDVTGGPHVPIDVIADEAAGAASALLANMANAQTEVRAMRMRMLRIYFTSSFRSWTLKSGVSSDRLDTARVSRLRTVSPNARGSITIRHHAYVACSRNG